MVIMASLTDLLRRDFTVEEVNFITDNAAALGILMKSASLDSFPVTPLALLPSIYPEAAVSAISEAQGAINIMVDGIARNTAWLHSLIEPIAESDEFTMRLLQISKNLHSEGLRQKKFLGILRSDYMMDVFSNKPLQVEINTISSGLGVISYKMRDLHRLVIQRFAHLFEKPPSLASLAPATAFQHIVDALASAVRAYGETGSVLMVVEENERNVFDQLPLSFELLKQQ